MAPSCIMTIKLVFSFEDCFLYSINVFLIEFNVCNAKTRNSDSTAPRWRYGKS